MKTLAGDYDIQTEATDGAKEHPQGSAGTLQTGPS